MIRKQKLGEVNSFFVGGKQELGEMAIDSKPALLFVALHAFADSVELCYLYCMRKTFNVEGQNHPFPHLKVQRLKYVGSLSL